MDLLLVRSVALALTNSNAPMNKCAATVATWLHCTCEVCCTATAIMRIAEHCQTIDKWFDVYADAGGA